MRSPRLPVCCSRSHDFGLELEQIGFCLPFLYPAQNLIIFNELKSQHGFTMMFCFFVGILVNGLLPLIFRMFLRMNALDAKLNY